MKGVERIDLAQIETCGKRNYFVTESPRAMRDMAAFTPDGDGLLIEALKKLKNGADVDPVVLTRRNGELDLAYGWYTCAAAALLGHAEVNAYVFDVTSTEDEGIVAEAAFNCFEDGLPREECLAAITDQLSEHERFAKAAE